jgi:hypothetical protein
MVYNDRLSERLTRLLTRAVGGEGRGGCGVVIKGIVELDFRFGKGGLVWIGWVVWSVHITPFPILQM